MRCQFDPGLLFILGVTLPQEHPPSSSLFFPLLSSIYYRRVCCLLCSASPPLSLMAAATGSPRHWDFLAGTHTGSCLARNHCHLQSAEYRLWRCLAYNAIIEVHNHSDRMCFLAMDAAYLERGKRKVFLETLIAVDVGSFFVLVYSTSFPLHKQRVKHFCQGLLHMFSSKCLFFHVACLN